MRPLFGSFSSFHGNGLGFAAGSVGTSSVASASPFIMEAAAAVTAALLCNSSIEDGPHLPAPPRPKHHPHPPHHMQQLAIQQVDPTWYRWCTNSSRIMIHCWSGSSPSSPAAAGGGLTSSSSAAHASIYGTAADGSNSAPCNVHGPIRRAVVIGRFACCCCCC